MCPEGHQHGAWRPDEGLEASAHRDALYPICCVTPTTPISSHTAMIGTCIRVPQLCFAWATRIVTIGGVAFSPCVWAGMEPLQGMPDGGPI